MPLPIPATEGDDDPLQSPQLSDKDFVPQPLPKVRQLATDGAPAPPLKDLPIHPPRPVLPQQSSSNPQSTLSTYYESTRRASLQLLAGDESAVSIIPRAFAAHVSVLASADCEEILRHKGINGGLLELLRPYGERINGRIVIRDSTGASKPWDNFGIRFIGVNDGLEPPQIIKASKETAARDPAVPTLDDYRPARLRSGGDLEQVDRIIGAHLDHVEEQMRTVRRKSEQETSHRDVINTPSAHSLFLRRILSGTVNSPHETFSHPVTQIIAISSRNPQPIEELRKLYTSGKTGPDRPPIWVNNEFLRYYVLVHDEDYDDIKKSTVLFEQMKRHFGLHCHLLRLRSTQCLATDDGSVTLPVSEWTSAGELLADAEFKETNQDEEARPCIFESDVAAVQSFIREMVAQSLVPMMERTVATWNDQVASRRRGLSGRFMSLSKRFTPFGGGRIANVPGLSRASSESASSTSGNYDSTTGVYKPDSPEAIMRKLADYALMLRDYKLAQSTYEIIAADYKSDKAWKYFAGANEMSALTTLINVVSAAATPTAGATRAKVDLVATIRPLLENAYYNYNTRASGPFYAVRCVLMAVEMLHHHATVSPRARNPPDDLAVKWLCKMLDDNVLGPTGRLLVMQSVAGIYAVRPSRARKTAFWNVLAGCGYAELSRPIHAQHCLASAREVYASLARHGRGLAFGEARRWIESGPGPAPEAGSDEEATPETERVGARAVSADEGQTRAHTDLLRDQGRESPEPDEDGFV